MEFQVMDFLKILKENEKKENSYGTVLEELGIFHSSDYS
jgi:hypothetical protein